MIVHVNKNIPEYETAWEFVGDKNLKVVNTTGKHGKIFEKVFLGYKKFGKNFYIFINKHVNLFPIKEKICGIWISDCDYVVIGSETFTGISKDSHGIAGRFGIYDVGTVIQMGNRRWILKENGWKIKF